MGSVFRSFAGATLVACGVLLVGPSALGAQLPPAEPKDVATIEGIVHAYYDVINGPAGTPRQWRRDSTLYMPGAMFVAMTEAGGAPKASPMTPEDFRRSTDADFVKHGFFETEIGHRIERFGNVAEVRSVYETRREAGGPLLGRGINYLLVYWDGQRWWITSAVWDDERPDNALPPDWIGAQERAP